MGQCCSAENKQNIDTNLARQALEGTEEQKASPNIFLKMPRPPLVNPEPNG